MEESEPLLDIEQAARFLNVSETSLRRWTNDGRLVCLRVGRRRERRFRRADLLAFLEGGPAVPSRTPGSLPHGTHLCGLYCSEEGQVRQAVSFFAGGFPPRSVSFLVGRPETRARILAGLEREYPDLAVALAEGRMIISDYAENASAQLEWWETRMSEAARRGAMPLRAIGDAGAFVATASREELADYEAGFDRRIAGRFPVIAMCQYDVRQFSGLVVLDTLKSHPHSFGQSAERILA